MIGAEIVIGIIIGVFFELLSDEAIQIAAQ
jgi:hypothetical protein